MSETEEYKQYVAGYLETLKPIFARASQGDYSLDVPIPEAENEFTELSVGIQVMLDVIRRQFSELQGLNALLQEKIHALEESSVRQAAQESEIRKLRERFVFVAAHELKAPLAAMEWGLAELLGDETLIKSLSGEQKETLYTVERKNKNLIALTADLLRVARMHNQVERLTVVQIDFKNIARHVAEIATPLQKENNIQISWLLFEKDIPPVAGDEIALKEVLSNLITNAIRYNKPQGSVVVNAQPDGDTLVVRVSDTGIGIDAEKLPNLFKEFSRIQSDETRKVEGTGLGLFITKELLKRMNGTISVDSKKGEGSVFQFSIPLWK